MPLPLKILICGAGIGGNALAFLLSKYPHLFNTTVVERSPTLRTNGLQVDLRGHGIAAIKRMGLEATIRAHCVQELGLQLVDTQGRRWGYWPASKGSGAQAFTSEFEIMRGDLCRVFYEGAREVVRYKFGTFVTAYTDTHTNGPEGPIRVGFNDGTIENYDVLVGADGLYSRTRKMMLEAEHSTRNPVHVLDQYIAYLRLPIHLEPNETYTTTAYLGTRGRFILTRRNSPTHLQIYLMSQHLAQKLKDVHDTSTQKALFASEFSDMGWKADQYVQLLKESDDFYCQHEAFIKLNPWSRGHVTLLGDAGYCLSTNGCGTSCAIVGAYILAGELVRHISQKTTTDSQFSQPVQASLAEYENKLRPLVEILQKGLEEEEEGPGGGFELKDWHIPVVLWLAWFASLFRVYKLAWFFSDRGVKGWELPDYPELDETKA